LRLSGEFDSAAEGGKGTKGQLDVFGRTLKEDVHSETLPSLDRETVTGEADHRWGERNDWKGQESFEEEWGGREEDSPSARSSSSSSWMISST